MIDCVDVVVMAVSFVSHTSSNSPLSYPSKCHQRLAYKQPPVGPIDPVLLEYLHFDPIEPFVGRTTEKPVDPMQSQPPSELEQQHWNAIESLRESLRDVESDATWDHVIALRKVGTSSVLERSLAWCTDPDPYRRSIGVSVLAQLGDDGNRYPEEATSMIRSMIGTENDHEVITSLISAVHFRGLSEGVPWLTSLALHPSENIRWRVAWALPIPNTLHPDTDQSTLDTLLRLCADPEPRVRDWATFSLSLTDEDSPQIREALLARLNDPDFDTRSEAAVGLAKRKEERGIEPLVGYLKSDRVGELFVEAAEMYADPRLKPALVALQKWWDINPDLLARAIAACS